jgi:NADPH-dependent 2,4-dienoyl-CoA reductase/sulfur reductase-like enzyme
MGPRLVIIGADPGGMAAVSAARAEEPDLQVVALERGRRTSYSACGIPYLVGGEVEDVHRLVARSPDQHRANGIDVRLGHEAVAIDLAARQVEVRDLDGARTYRLDFDHLLVATGGTPMRPELPGIDLEFVRGVQTLGDAEELVDLADAIQCRRVVVVGGGYIGLEMAEAFLHRGASVALVERSSHVMSTLDPDMAVLVQDALRRHGVDLHMDTAVEAFEPGVVVTADGTFDADLVVLGIGVAPNSGLAAAAGLDLGARKAIRVDRRQRTSAEGVWSAGDCCESRHLVSGQHVHVALGTVANKQSRVAGTNIGGGYATFPGVLGTAISKICDTEVARTGLSTAEAAQAGFAATMSTIEATTKAGYYPGAEPMTVRFVVEDRTGRLLGAQIVGGAGSAKRIDTCAVAITAGMTVDQIAQLDLAYAPPFSGVWDPVLVAARGAITARR